MKKISLTCLSWLMCLMVVVAQSIPSPASFLGYQVGQKFTPHHRIVGYFEALAKAAPRQSVLQQYGQTNEGRPLLLFTISSANNMANLENIRLNNLKLAGLESGTANTNAPAIVWLSYNVHGNEASSSEAVMLTAYQLLTDPTAQQWLNNTVVIIDPCLNPDGRDRYVNWYNSMVGDRPNPNPAAREHVEPWPGGRSNHYNFDLNRDWAWQTQVETQQRIPQYNKWMPQIHVDFHEQGYNEPYYFAPAAEPLHEVITPWQRNFQNQIGRNHAKYFDAKGWLYFTKERFDLFYPSYGDTWPTYNGSIGMTYEQGGIRAGLAIKNDDGDTLTLTDRAMHHHTTGWSTVEIAAKNAADLVKNFQQFFSNVRSNGAGEYKTFVITAKNNEAKLQKLKDLLQKNGIEYGYANAGAAKGYNYFTGKEEAIALSSADVLISTQQPRGAMVKVLFEPTSKLSDSATYDITAWSLPFAYGIPAYAVREKLAINTTQPIAPPLAKLPENGYGYLVSWNSMNEAAFVAATLQAGIKPRVSQKPFTVNGKNYPAGTVLYLRTSNQFVPDFDKKVQQLAVQNKVLLESVSTGFMDKGPDFGSPDVKTIQAPRIAMATGEGSSSLGAGELWHYFDRELNYPVTLINIRDMASLAWSKYDVVVLPNGFNYRSLFDKDGEMRAWIQQGGKLILMENAVAQLASANWGLSNKKEDEERAAGYNLLKTYEGRERESLKDNNPGSIFKVELDNSHPLAYGYPNTYFTLKSDDVVYDFLKDGWNVGVIKKESQVAGFSGVNTRKRLQDGVLFGEIPLGRGAIVFLTDDVIFRNFWENGKLMLANALFMVNPGMFNR